MNATPEMIYAEAHRLGIEHGNRAKPVPMGVFTADPITGKPIACIDIVSEGVCGFAWVKMKGKGANNLKFLKWAKANNIFSKSCMGGFVMYVGEFSQSMTRKEAYADAFTKTLRHYGIDCHYESRMD